MRKALAFCAFGVIGFCVIINQNQSDSSSMHDLDKYVSSGKEEGGEPISVEAYNE